MEKWKIAELKASGVDVALLWQEMGLAWIDEQITKWWPSPANRECSRFIAPQDHADYYENLAAAAMSGNTLLFEMFYMVPGVRVTKEQKVELLGYLNRSMDTKHPNRHPWTLEYKKD